MAQVLAPVNALDKLQGVAHAAGAAVHPVEEALLQPLMPAAHKGLQQPSSSSSSNEWLLPQATTSQQPDSGALIIYTSGTTGRPKGALHTHRCGSSKQPTLIRVGAASRAHSVPINCSCVGRPTGRVDTLASLWGALILLLVYGCMATGW